MYCLKKFEIKKNLRDFKGFVFEASSPELNKKRDMLSKLHTKGLKILCETLDLERSGYKDELIERILEFLLLPKITGRKAPQPKKRGRAAAAGRKGHDAAKSKAKEETGDEVDDDEEDEDQEDEDDEKGSEEESEGEEGKEEKSNDEKEESDKEEEEEEQEEEEEEEEKPKSRGKRGAPKKAPAPPAKKKPEPASKPGNNINFN